MIRPPEHPLGFAFEKAREWEREQQLRLTEAQKRSYSELVNRQAHERRLAQERLDVFRTQLQERAKRRKPKDQLLLNPPFRVADPYVVREARSAIAAEKRLERLDCRHREERRQVLQKLEKERDEAQHGSKLTRAWTEALNKTVAQERDRHQPKELDKSR